MRHRCMLQAVQRIPDGMGGFVEDWADLRPFWAEITTPSGRVSTVAQQLTAVVSAEIRTHPIDALVVGRRIVHRGVTYRIEAVLPDNERAMVRVLCSNIPHP